MPGKTIIHKAEAVGLDPRLLYEAVIDLSAAGLLTANCLNHAAGILLHDLGLPRYVFETIKKPALITLLQSIATSISLVDGKMRLYGRVAHVDFNLDQDGQAGHRVVRIATEESRASMESHLEGLIAGHRREYYYSPNSGYSTYIVRPETVADFTPKDFGASRFLFSLAGDYHVTPPSTRKRYQRFLRSSEKQILPLISVFNLPQSDETRLMFNSDFETPQLPVLRKLLADHGFTLTRAYWEPYLAKGEVAASICSYYVQGEMSRSQEEALLADIRAFLSVAIKGMEDLYVRGLLSFQQMLFASNAVDFCHLFLFQESENHSDRELLDSLDNSDQRETFGKRLYSSNRAIYGLPLIADTLRKHLDLVRELYALFAARFHPPLSERISQEALAESKKQFEHKLAGRFIDFKLGGDIFRFMFKFISSTLKTNFYKADKRSFAFRLDQHILDPLVFRQNVHGVFYINGHYACGTHLRAADIARGGLRMLRITRANHLSELDQAVLLNYALGPKAQRLKHKDICESGAKGVVVTHPQYAGHTREALADYTEGILDLMLPDAQIVDYLGQPELIFFGPDEGTAPLMDEVAENARRRGYRHWRSFTTGKNSGLPHDTYGVLQDGQVFGLFNRGTAGVELQIQGEPIALSTDMAAIYERIGGRIVTSGMTTTGVMHSFRTLIEHAKEREEELNVMLTGGPDGDLGANQIQSFKGKICLIIDGGSVLFDPAGLDKQSLMELAFARHSSPRLNSSAFPLDKLSPAGFMVPIGAGSMTLPDGRHIDDCALFHRRFLVDPANRELIQAAKIRAFIPCGGFKDTINHANVGEFAALFQELRFIVEGANVFFDDAARRCLATHSRILQIKDFSANKGGVFSSSVAEVLSAFLLQDHYEALLVDDLPTRWALIGDVLMMVAHYARLETKLLLQWRDLEPQRPLFELSELSSEYIFALQDQIMEKIEQVLADEDLVWSVLERYIPPILLTKLGRPQIVATLNTPELRPYRNAILSKKLASLAFYRFGLAWKDYLQSLDENFISGLHAALG